MTATLITLFGISAAGLFATLAAYARVHGRTSQYRKAADHYLETRLQETAASPFERSRLLALLRDRDIKLALTEPTAKGFRWAIWCFAFSVALSLLLVGIEVVRGEAMPWIGWIQLVIMVVVGIGLSNFGIDYYFYLQLDRLLPADAEARR